MTRVAVKPELLQWARERAALTTVELDGRFPKLAEWESGASRPTLKQLEAYARVTRAPVGYFFLPEPPEEPLPIPDFRTIAGRPVGRPSPDLLDTLYICQERQAWYQEFAQVTGQPPLPFVGSVTTRTAPAEAARRMREALGFDLESRRRCSTWTEALRSFIELADKAGVLVMVSGVVLNNNSRRLKPEEFRGFVLASNLAPLVFINGADTKAAQMFTLAHELAHVWLGASALSDASVASQPAHAVEAWCNQVAAEILVPLQVLRSDLHTDEPLAEAMSRLARLYKVSTLVILRRLLDVGHLTRQRFTEAYEAELRRLMALPGSSGGNFYLTAAVRVSKRFARALVESTLEGRTLYRDAFRMLGVSKLKTFNEIGASLQPTL